MHSAVAKNAENLVVRAGDARSQCLRKRSAKPPVAHRVVERPRHIPGCIAKPPVPDVAAVREQHRVPRESFPERLNKRQIFRIGAPPRFDTFGEFLLCFPGPAPGCW